MLVSIKPTIFVTTAIYLCCAPALIAHSFLAPHPAESRRTPVSIENRLQVIDMLPGTAKPELQSELVAGTEGVLAECLVAPGDHVEEGELLARLDDRVAKASLALARSEASGNSKIAIAEEQLVQARSFFYRIQEAYRYDAASAAEYDKARGAVTEFVLALDMAKEDQRSAEAKVKIELAKVAAHEIRAPFSGTVIRVDARVGERTATSTGLIVVANFERLHVEQFVPIEYVDRLQVGETYSLFADAPINRYIKAKLIFKEPTIDPATSTVKCSFLINNTDESFASGFTSRLCVPRTRSDENEW